ncbi:hypothetical protein ACFLYN_04960 [Chloroflexota bacterium]
MSVHSDVDYKCESCDCRYVPLPGAENCPRCGCESTEVYYDFILKALWSAQYNLHFNGRSFKAPIWGAFTIGDRYYWITFEFLSYMAKSFKVAERALIPRKLTENEINELVNRFISEVDISEWSYIETAIRKYLTLVAEALAEKSFDEESVRLLFKQISRRRRKYRYT